jgi:D-glycero-alpha-D-manno-heptose-7-phosphate kinase
MRTVAARAPTRIDFGGGWTDVPPYSTREGGVVCNVAIQRLATVTLTERPENGGPAGPDEVEEALARAALARAHLQGVSATIHSDFPRGAGLGGSSAAGVAMAGAIRWWRREALEDRGAVAEESRTVEVEDLAVAGGRQDHYAAAFGGALELTFGERTVTRQLALSAIAQEALETRCVVMHTGHSRISGSTIRGVLDAYTAGETRVRSALARMKALAREMATAIERNDIDALGGLVLEHWSFQRSLHPGIPTPLIDEMIARARRAGALGGKALGASGGGCVLLVATNSGVAQLLDAVHDLGERVPFRIDRQGLAVEVP